ncbi:MAG: AEC family transporter [Neisseria sp.]|jgi:auxin efflux carrier (AEC)|uniref:AEC family transporter n=1 Tax=Uruburuella suis TaxID=252130 RepID=UPI001B3FC0F8|nr:AEC family transporter [Neisseria sp.]MBP7968677.1 AEC family transporter [Neisseria sp.]MBP8043595.1 AEC family transporter [Neisseria sp.]MBP8070068.1 AEC family transporter [Neisseria sp.]MBP8875820.1 AEC family transporter [Neisseria sp.]
MIFLTAVESVLSIVLIIALGFYLRNKGWFADSFAGNISKLIMNIALSASIFVSVLTYLTRDKLMALSDGLIYGALSIVFGYLIAWLMVKVLKVRRGRRGVFINTIVNANTIFIGLPLNIALFGEASMPYFLVYYVLNTVSTWAFGAFLIANDSTEPQPAHRQKFNWKKLLPAPLLGFLVALVFLLADIPVPSFIHSTLDYVGSIVTPLSLLYIGITLADAGLKSIRFDKDTIAALLGKFVLAPLIMVALIAAGHSILPLPSLEAKTLIVQSSVSALAVLPILANEAKGDVRFATNVVTTSTILFMIVVPLVDTLLQMF